MGKQEKKNEATLRVADPIENVQVSPEVCEAIKGLKPEQRSVIMQAIRQESFSGPIPHPELLQKYDKVQPGFAERIVSMSEKQLDHRINCETKVVDGAVAESKRGQNYGLAVCILFLIATVFLGYLGHDWLAGSIGCGTLVSLVAIFVTGQKDKG